ncbi:clarin-3 [Aythya fuligula]|uniref:Clarin-3 n=1 Tax=Aythya fuligula TaxID=219594 RepID=A0A6J3D844_AYTFU|nr:clarin-3 [Aythya fuligula]
MPTREKKLMFGAAFLTSVLSFVIICVVLGTQRWISSTVYFSQSNSSTSVTVTYGLFSGTCASTIHGGVQVSDTNFQVAELLNSTRKGINVAIIVLLVLSLLSSLLSSGFTFTNAVSNPYQTFLGPIGVYTWNAIGGFFTLIVMILFAVNVQGNNLSVELAIKCASTQQNHTRSKHNYDYSYWILLLHILFSCATIVIIVFYSCARYTKKKEQERPIENASKDVILF